MGGLFLFSSITQTNDIMNWIERFTKKSAKNKSASLKPLTIRFAYFAYNFCYNFIELVWYDNDHQRTHLREKFKAKADHNQCVTGGTFLDWFMELDEQNQTTLINWIDENYTG